MKEIKDILKNQRVKLGLTMLEVAQRVGVSEGTVSRWESGDIANMRRDKIMALSKALQIPPATIMGWESDDQDVILTPNNIYPITRKRFPLLGEIACGEPIFADEDHETYVEASADIKADFCLTAKGDSMIGARIQDGDIVFIREMPMVNNGEIAAVIIDNEATLKRVYYYPDKAKLILNPENPAYEPLVYIGEELNQIRILGKAVSFMSNL